MPPMRWNSHLYTGVLLLSMLVFVLRAIQTPQPGHDAGAGLLPIESYVTAAAEESTTIAF